MHVFHVNYREHCDIYIFAFLCFRPSVAHSWARESAVCMKIYTRSAATSALFRSPNRVYVHFSREHKFSKFCLKCVHSCNFNSASLFALGFFSWANTCCYGIWTIYALFFFGKPSSGPMLSLMFVKSEKYSVDSLFCAGRLRLDGWSQKSRVESN